MAKTNTKTKRGPLDRTQIYHQIFNQADDIILLIDRKGRIFDINNKIKELGGYKREDLVGKKLTSLKGILAKESIPIVAKNFIKRMAGRKVEPYEIILNKKNGEKVWAEVSASAIKKDGKIIGDLAIVRDINERKLAEEQVLVERDRAQKYLDVANVIMVALDSDGRVTLINKIGADVLGYKEKDIIGKNWFMHFIPKDIRDKTKKVFNKLMQVKGEFAKYYENPILTKKKDVRVIAWHNTILKDNKGHIVGTLSSGEDVTEKNEAKEKLSTSEKKYRELVENANDIIYTHDLMGNFTSVNKAGARIFGYSHDEILKMNIKDIVDPNYLVIAKKKIFEKIAGKARTGPYELLTRNKKGKEVWVGVSTRIIKKGGQPIGVQGIARDVTDRKKIENALLESEKRFKDVAFSSADFIWEVDKKGKYTFASGNVEKILGYRPEEIIGMTPFDLMSTNEAKKLKNIFRGIVKKNERIDDLKNWNITKSGKKVCLLTNGVPIFDNKGDFQGYRGVDKDVTRVEEIDRMKSEFVTVVSHQLRTPLTSIKWFLEILLAEKDDSVDSKQRKMLSQIAESNERMIKLINNLLNVSRIESGRIKVSLVRTQLEDIVKKTIDKYFTWAESSNISIKINKPTRRLPKVKVDVEQIRQVIQNLVSNAIKYSIRGNISINLRKIASVEARRMKTTAEKKGFVDHTELEGEIAKVSEAMAKKKSTHSVIFSIKDHGVGIPRYQQKRVFQKFYRGDNVIKMQTEGSGLGLYLCKAIVESLGGNIWFESTPNKGSTFYFTVPI